MAKAFSPKLAMKANLHIYVVQIGMLLIMMIKLELDSIEKALTTMVSTCMEMKLLQTSETYRILLAAGRITPAQYNVLEVFYLIQQ
jgi:hypothetical protein